jgi:hypothetical protein
VSEPEGTRAGALGGQVALVTGQTIYVDGGGSC